MFSFSMAATNRRTVRTIMTVLDALIEITISEKDSSLQIRKNSRQDSTIPSGVSPYRLIILSDSDPWFTPMRIAVLCLRHIWRKGTNLARILSISAAYSSSVYSKCLNFRAQSTKLPGLIRTFSTILAAASAALGLKWISAIRGV